MNKTYLAVIFLTLSFMSCHYDNDDFSSIDLDTRWWILTRPNNNSVGTSEIVLYNETKSIIERTIDLPAQLSSPHALEYDGEFLWLGGMGENESIYKLNPEDGTVISELANIRTQGIAYLNGTLYYSLFGRIHQISQDGSLIQEITLATDNNPSDIAIHQESLYYVYNGSMDPIIKVNQSHSTEETIGETQIVGIYTLAVHNDYLIATTNSNAIRRFDLNSGDIISDSETIIEGWITAITPYNN